MSKKKQKKSFLWQVVPIFCSLIFFTSFISVNHVSAGGAQPQVSPSPTSPPTSTPCGVICKVVQIFLPLLQSQGAMAPVNPTATTVPSYTNIQGLVYRESGCPAICSRFIKFNIGCHPIRYTGYLDLGNGQQYPFLSPPYEAFDYFQPAADGGFEGHLVELWVAQHENEAKNPQNYHANFWC